MPDLDPDVLDTTTLISLTGAAWSAYSLAHLRSTGDPGVRATHGYVFQHLLDHDPTVGELAARLGVTQQATSKMLAEMERLGYVTRVPDADDRRIRRVTFTDQGRSVVQRDRESRAANERDLLATHGAEAVDTCRTVLRSVLERLGDLDAVRRRAVRPPEA